MGAKRRVPVKTVAQSARERELLSLVEALHIIDTVVQGKQEPTQEQEARHRLLLRDYLQMRDQFTAARAHVLFLARERLWHQMSAAIFAMDERQAAYEAKRVELTVYRKELES